MKSAYDRIIGIDPDCDKSGVAEVYIPSKHVNATKLLFPELMDYLQYMKREFSGNGEKILVVVEAGWMNRSNWHTDKIRSIPAAAKAGQNTGRNHEVARKIAEMSRHYGLETMEVKPLIKCWKGTDGKISHEEMQRLLTCSGFHTLDSRCNQEVRDALLIALNYSGIPLKYKP